MGLETTTHRILDELRVFNLGNRVREHDDSLSSIIRRAVIKRSVVNYHERVKVTER